MITIPPEKMIHSVPPNWHVFVLSSRQAQKIKGEQKPMNWSDAKQHILNKIIHI